MKSLLAILILAPCILAAEYWNSNRFIYSINAHNSTWKAGRNFGPNVSAKYIKGLMGVVPLPDEHLLPRKEMTPLPSDLPASFDAREEWPECTSIAEIRDQGACGSCWAVSTASVITDRVCIHSGGKKQFHFSSQHLTSCCKKCGNGCYGGDPLTAFMYWESNGIVSGGPYASKQGCQPYEVKSCEHHVEGSKPPCGDIQNTPQCHKKCTNANYKTSYENDLHFGKDPSMLHNDPDQIRAEIYKNGPVVAAFTVYEDFLNYKSGVYQHLEGNAESGHAIKLIGWGEENGTPYWLAVNSWNSDWGDNGYFKFLRGSNHCGIEKRTCAGLPA